MINIRTLIMQAATNWGVGFRASYSGRAMYGRSCIGVTGSLDSIQQMIGEVSGELLDLVFEAAIDSDDNTNEAYSVRDCARGLLEKLVHYNWDSMGLDTIVYWPHFEPLSDEEIQQEMGLPSDDALEEMSDEALREWIRKYPHLFDATELSEQESHDDLVDMAVNVRDAVISQD